MKDIVQTKLDSYKCRDATEELHALKEITQDLVLYALKQANFFHEATFLGGTCLRICHNLDRFSEDLDFATKTPHPKFNLDFYLEKAMNVMGPYGYNLSIDKKDLDNKTVKARFLKDDSIKKVLTFKHQHNLEQKIKIKIEVDANPPPGATEKTEYVDFPTDFSVSTHDLQSLMAGKLHALLCRQFSKGRDWYDFNWYISKGISPNLELLKNALFQFGPWEGKNLELNVEFVRNSLRDKIESLDWDKVKNDVSKFLSTERQKSLDLWSADFFTSKLRKLV